MTIYAGAVNWDHVHKLISIPRIYLYRELFSF